MSANNVRAGRAYVEIAADSSRLGRDLRAAQSQIRGFGDSVRNIGLQMGAIFSGAAFSGGILNSAKSFADAGSALDDLSQRSGALGGITRCIVVGGQDFRHEYGDPSKRVF